MDELDTTRHFLREEPTEIQATLKVESTNSLSEKGFDIFKKICIATGSPIRFLVLQDIFATMGSLVLSKGASQVFGWGLTPIGFAAQTVFEWKAMGNAYECFIRKEEPQQYTSHPTARGHVNRFAVAHGVIITLCLLSATLQALGILGLK